MSPVAACNLGDFSQLNGIAVPVSAPGSQWVDYRPGFQSFTVITLTLGNRLCQPTGG
jgi:hypothetical protein